MKFLADVNIPQSLITQLRDHDYDVLDIKKIDIKAKDTNIIKLAQEQNRIILTRDEDFISLTQYPKYRVPTIVIRLKNQKPHNISLHVFELLTNQNEETLTTSLTVITEKAANSYPYE